MMSSAAAFPAEAMTMSAPVSKYRWPTKNEQAKRQTKFRSIPVSVPQRYCLARQTIDANAASTPIFWN